MSMHGYVKIHETSEIGADKDDDNVNVHRHYPSPRASDKPPLLGALSFSARGLLLI
jgi:hypothetical protein